MSVKLTETQCIERLEELGWVYGYLSGHGDTELITKIIDNELYQAGDVEKSRQLYLHNK